jgi:hypothetical protein
MSESANKKELVVIEDAGFVQDYPKFNLTRNRVEIYKGKEFDINDFICLQVLTNHDPKAVDMVQIIGQNTHIYYGDGTPTRVIDLEERKVLWERYTVFMIGVRRKMLDITNPNHPDYVEPKMIKENKVITIS